MSGLTIGRVLGVIAWLGAAAPAAAQEHAHGAHEHPPQQERSTPVPPVTDADRAAAFPPGLDGHEMHDRAVNYFVLFDALEWQSTRSSGGVSWDNKGWIGGDKHRAWFRTEGETHDGRLENAQVQILYGRPFSRWWDVVAGVRQDLRPGPAQTWAALGVQGLAPYWFEIEATGFVGAGGRTQARFEVEYELLLTNRLILQPLVEVQLAGKADPERGLGAGLTSTEAGLRLRYEFRREFAPYVGVVWERTYFGTRRFAEAAGDDAGGGRLALGVRTWF